MKVRLERGTTVVFVAGTAPQPKGTSMLAWVNMSSRRRHRQEVPAASRATAEWMALCSALRRVRSGRKIVVITACSLLLAEFRDWLPFAENRVRVVARTRQLINQHGLDVHVYWLPGRLNRAAKLVRRYIVAQKEQVLPRRLGGFLDLRNGQQRGVRSR
jgi:hypothetical protein